MARKSNTSITAVQSQNHVKTAAYRRELSCTKIVGFHLQQLRTGATWRFRYTNANGQKKPFAILDYVDGTTDRVKAAEIALKYRADVSNGIDILVEKNKSKEETREDIKKFSHITVGEYLNLHYKTKHLSRQTDAGIATFNKINSSFENYLTKAIVELDETSILEWQQEKEAKPLAHETIKSYYALFRTMIRKAVSDGFVASNPLDSIKLLKPKSDGKTKKKQNDDLKKRRMLTQLELDELSLAISTFKKKYENIELLETRETGLWFYAFYKIGAYTGFRVGDLHELRWEEINFDNNTIVITPAKTQHHEDPIQVVIHLRPAILKEIGWWHSLNNQPTSGYVFGHYEERKRDRQAHDTYWKELLGMTKIKHSLHFYSLRHHFCSKLVSKGIPLFTVARLAGHKSIRMIEQHYGHLSPDDSMKAMDIIAADF